MKKFFKTSIAFLSMFIGLFGIFKSVEAQELTDFYFTSQILSEQVELSGPNYGFILGNDYSLRVNFNIPDPEFELDDGKYLLYRIPSPFTIENTDKEIIDPKTGIAIADVAIVSKGENEGGSAKITFKNIDTYLNTKAETGVRELSSQFLVPIQFKKKQVSPLEVVLNGINANNRIYVTVQEAEL